MNVNPRSVITVCFLAIGPGLFAQPDRFTYDAIPDVTYEEIADRLTCVEGEVPLNFNERVKAFVDYFTIRDRPYTREVLGYIDAYFPIFEEALKRYGLPDELKYLAIVESGLRPNAISHASAVGLWQFVASTGRLYGLKSDWYLDDRMDPYLASDAAARHLRDLYSMFDDWELALAAYNCGPGNVRKAIRNSGYKKHFWDIYRYLPRETRSYVPQFVAIVYTVNYSHEHNLYPEEVKMLPIPDTILISQYFHLETLADQLNVCLEDLLELNPNVKRGAVPEGKKDFSLRIPEDLKAFVTENRQILYDTAGKVGKEQLEYLARNTPGSTYGRVRQVYRVRSGDVLGTIARRYHVRVSDIRIWNGLSGNLIRVGQRLNIWVLPTYNTSTKDLYTSSARTEKSLALASASRVHQVQAGDTLWGIANQYPNVSIEEIKKLNDLTNNTIRPGQQLIISLQ